jgi:class 3 adenylate cyclase/FixJ family two-component response regulator
MVSIDRKGCLAGERVLVVDDGQENRQFIVDYILRPNGFEAVTARDGREGLEMIVRYRPDLILLDYQMPRMNGIDVIKTLAGSNWNIPIILMTFHGSEEIAVEVFRLGVRDYVKKPFTVDEMLAAIERSLDDVRLRREKEALTTHLIQKNLELQNRVQELNVLYSVGKIVTSLMDMDALLPHIVDAAVKITGADEAFLYLVQKQRLVCQAQRRHTQARAEAAHFEVSDPLALRAIESGKTDQYDGTTSSEASLAYAPLVLGGQVIGVLGARNLPPSGRAFTNHQTALLSALTDYAAIAIQNARNVEQLRQTKENEKARIRSTFQRFVPPQVVDQILENPEALQLGGTRQEVTILFADIRGYTTFSENLPPEEVVKILNDYLSLAANMMMSYGGTLDKYMGDGLMAIFNAPDPQPHHADAAVEAALTLQQAARDLAWQRRDGLSFSIGINIGEAVVGYIGTDCAINYTAIGDVVNLAKRLQEFARPGQILVERAVIERLKRPITAQPLGEIKLKGRRQNAIAYELQAATAG